MTRPNPDSILLDGRELPLVEHGGDWPHQDVLAVGLMNGKPLCRLWLWKETQGDLPGHWGFGIDLAIEVLDA